jgi:DNA-binding CsgD family transcriptional regulator
VLPELHENESEAAARLHAAFEQSGNPMVLVDDRRRWVTANGPACDLLPIEPEDVPWRRLDDFALAEDRDGLDAHWEVFLEHGAVEGWYQLPLPSGRLLPIEFSATANVLPGRHLSVVMRRPSRPPTGRAHGELHTAGGGIVISRREPLWTRIVPPDDAQLPLTERESEVLGLVADGLRGGEIAEHLVLSVETIKSHVQNAMTKLGAHTRAHAVAIGLRTGQIVTSGEEAEADDAD